MTIRIGGIARGRILRRATTPLQGRSMLVVLRGNSASGKSTVGRVLQRVLGWPTAVLEQDHFRRVVYAEREQEHLAHADLLEAAAAHALSAGHHVILDGVFSATRYAAMLERVAVRAGDARFFAFDLSFEETARRHGLREKASVVTVEEMRSWFHGWQPLPFVQERRIGPEETVPGIVNGILHPSA